MTREDFMSRVLAPLGRLTGDEQADIRKELEEHIEDRMEALLEMGWAPELAEERSLEAMGDPAEIGREMAKQYRGRGWVWLGRAAVILTVVLCIQAVLSVGIWGFLWDSITTRIVPEKWTELNQVEASEDVDLRILIGNDILRIAQVNVGQRWDEEKRLAELVLCSYNRIPGGVVSHRLINGIKIENQRGEELWDGGSGSGSGHYMREQGTRYVDIEPGDTYVTLVYQWFGEDIRVEVSLPEGEAS